MACHRCYSRWVPTNHRMWHAAERIRHEITGQPGPAHALTLLERLAAEKGPLYGRNSNVQHLGPPPDLRSSEMST